MASRTATPQRVSEMTWLEMNEALRRASHDDQVKSMINNELTGSRRRSYLLRMQQRFNSLRLQREREELLSKIEG
jgi:hypothetical protein